LPPDKEMDLRPFPPGSKVWFIKEFIKKFDDHETLVHYQSYLDYQNEGDDEDEDSLADQVETILSHLRRENVVLPVKAHTDWREALIESWSIHRKESISQGIRKASENYQFHCEMGIAFQCGKILPETVKRVDDLKERFLNGRELAGEPRDFEI
jgi:hypothetical protein